jgi:hypothetical protein
VSGGGALWPRLAQPPLATNRGVPAAAALAIAVAMPNAIIAIASRVHLRAFIAPVLLP